MYAHMMFTTTIATKSPIAFFKEFVCPINIPNANQNIQQAAFMYRMLLLYLSIEFLGIEHYHSTENPSQ